MSHTPHDALFKAVFSDPARAMDEVRAVLAPEVSRHLDFASAELVPGSFVDEALRERHTDLLFRLGVGGREALAYLLLEHQSEPDPLMPFRVLRYMVRIWERWLEGHPGAPRLPAILPLVLSHGPSGWTAPRSLGDLYDLTPEALADLARWMPGFELPIDDLSAESDEALRRRATDALVTLVGLVLKHARDNDELAEQIIAWDDLFRRVRRAPNGVRAVGLVVRYLLDVGGITPQELIRLIEPMVSQETKEAFVTTAEMLVEEGVQKGLLKGREEGREEGMRQALVQTLLRQLGQRFGELPPDAMSRVRAADTDQLERWTDRVIAASSLDAVFGG